MTKYFVNTCVRIRSEQLIIDHASELLNIFFSLKHVTINGCHLRIFFLQEDDIFYSPTFINFKKEWRKCTISR